MADKIGIETISMVMPIKYHALANYYIINHTTCKIANFGTLQTRKEKWCGVQNP